MEDDSLEKSTTTVDSSISSKGVEEAENPITQDEKLEFSSDEETLIIRMYNLVGERWSLIAGRIPGRTADEIEKYWNSRNSTSEYKDTKTHSISTEEGTS